MRNAAESLTNAKKLAQETHCQELQRHTTSTQGSLKVDSLEGDPLKVECATKLPPKTPETTK